MVRFKNRYFLIELIPFTENNSESLTNSRYHSLQTVSKDNSNELHKPLADDKVPSFSSASVSNCVRKSVTLNFGTLASASLLQSLSVKYSNNSTRMIILRAPRDYSSQIWASLALLIEWPSENLSLPSSLRCTWRVVHCAGTIRSCQKAAIAFAKKQLRLSSSSLSGASNFEELMEPLAKKIKSIDP